MVSIEEELNEIEQDWEVKYIEETSKELLYAVELSKQEITLKVSIPDSYPEAKLQIEFGDKDMKGVDETIQQNIIRSLDHKMMNKIGEPMLKCVVEDIWNQIKAISAHYQHKNLAPKAVEKLKPQRKKKTGRKRAKMAAQFGLFGGGMQQKPTLANVIDQPIIPVATKENRTETLNKTVANETKSRFSKKIHGKASPMKTARDVINRLKWDEQLKNEEFIVGYEDRFVGIVEMPVFDLNWQDDIAATGPTDKLAIPEHRVQYFKWDSKIIWRKEDRTDFVFGSTGSKLGIVEFMAREKQKSEIAKNDIEVENIVLKASINETIDLGEINVDDSNVDELDIMAKKIVDDVFAELEKLAISSPDSFTAEELENESKDAHAEPKQVPHGGGRHYNHQSSRSGYSASHQNGGSHSRGHERNGNHRSRDRSRDSERRRDGRDRSGSNRSEDFSQSRDAIHCCIFTSRPQRHSLQNVYSLQKRLHQDILVPKYINFNLATGVVSKKDFERLKKILKDFSREMRSLELEFTEVKQIDENIIIQARETNHLTEFFERLKKKIEPCEFNFFPHITIAKIPQSLKEDIGSLQFSRFTHAINYVSIGRNNPPPYNPNLHRYNQRSAQSHHKRKMGNEFGQFQYQHPARKQRHVNQEERLKDGNWQVIISKKLSGILRHNRMGFQIDEEGFLEVNCILNHQFFKSHEVTEKDIVKIVKENKKQRFRLEGEEGNLKIRATQGHSVEFSREEDHLQEITDPSFYPSVVHGTSLKFWSFIKDEGLKRMNRNHIHMTTAEPSGGQVISGMRNSSNCFIYIDIEKAMKDGIKFYLSDNWVILSKGIDDIIPPTYFKEVYGIYNRKRELIYPVPESKAESESRPNNIAPFETPSEQEKT